MVKIACMICFECLVRQILNIRGDDNEVYEKIADEQAEQQLEELANLFRDRYPD